MHTAAYIFIEDRRFCTPDVERRFLNICGSQTPGIS